MNKQDVTIMLERLNSEKFFSGFKLRKSDCSLIQKFDWGWRRFQLERYNGYDLERKELALEIHPGYDVRFHILHKWFEKFCPIDLPTQRDGYSIGFNESMLLEKPGFVYCFLENRDNYEEDFENMKTAVIAHSNDVFSRFRTLNDSYII